MAVVALAALGSAGWVWVRRSSEYSKIADKYTTFERKSLNLMALFEELDKDRERSNRNSSPERDEMSRYANMRILELKENAVKEHAVADAYRRAARFPWLGAPRVKSTSEWD
jgi:hypothetical protein